MASVSVAFRGLSGPTAMLAGCLALVAGATLTFAALEATSAAAFLAGTVVAGGGFGTAMLGSFRTVSALAAPGQRAGLIAAYFIASYVAFSIPVVAAGLGRISACTGPPWSTARRSPCSARRRRAA